MRSPTTDTEGTAIVARAGGGGVGGGGVGGGGDLSEQETATAIHSRRAANRPNVRSNKAGLLPEPGMFESMIRADPPTSEKILTYRLASKKYSVADRRRPTTSTSGLVAVSRSHGILSFRRAAESHRLREDAYRGVTR